MWAHDYPFRYRNRNRSAIEPVMMKMKSYQKINKIPASGLVTSKVNLVISESPFIPKSFRIPNDADKLRRYAKEHPNTTYVQKNSKHRGIEIVKHDKLDLRSSGSFVQVFIDDPFLIDGYKFDIGVYTIVTSIDPLRIYVFDGDVLLRFCFEQYYPFDPENKDKYVIGRADDDYRPTWKVPILAKLYSDLGYTMKQTLNTHIKSLGKNSDSVWDQIYEIIGETYMFHEKELAEEASRYPYPRNFFEMVRFDFVLDANLKVYLMEVNMSPNLDSGHFPKIPSFSPQMRLMYEQVVYNVLRLTGVVRGGIFGHNLQSRSSEEEDMQVSDKDLAVYADECSSAQCSQPNSCDKVLCRLCSQCITSEEKVFLRMAYLEHVNRHSSKRIYPEPVMKNKVSHSFTEETMRNQLSDKLSKNNAKMHQWFIGKCVQSNTWCE